MCKPAILVLKRVKQEEEWKGERKEKEGREGEERVTDE